MDKIRKLVDTLWYNKERMVFGVMVCILLWHVYGIFNPPPDENKPLVLQEPNKENIPKVIENIAAMPDPPDLRPLVPWEGIYTPNPFWALSGQSSILSRNQKNEADISLIQIQQGIGGRWRAQLKTNVTDWYDEGESFESYQLLKIYPETKTVEVRSDRLGQILTLKAQRN